jgi:hypothetical protein
LRVVFLYVQKIVQNLTDMTIITIIVLSFYYILRTITMVNEYLPSSDSADVNNKTLDQKLDGTKKNTTEVKQ